MGNDGSESNRRQLRRAASLPSLLSRVAHESRLSEPEAYRLRAQLVCLVSHQLAGARRCFWCERQTTLRIGCAARLSTMRIMPKSAYVCCYLVAAIGAALLSTTAASSAEPGTGVARTLNVTDEAHLRVIHSSGELLDEEV